MLTLPLTSISEHVAMLKLLVLEGAVVTIDAMGCQTAIAAEIIERGAYPTAQGAPCPGCDPLL